MGEGQQTTAVAAPVTGFSHIQLNVADVARSAEWYRTVLGMETMLERPDVTALQNRAARLVVVIGPAERLDVSASPVDHLAFAVPILLVQTFFTLAVTYFFAAFNVAFRDLQHIVANLVQMMFFLTPVLWDVRSVSPMAGMTKEETQRAILTFNPMASVMSAWRDIFVQQTAPDWVGLLTVTGISLVLMLISTAVFERRREEFAELV